MKVFDILRKESQSLTEGQIINRLKTFDWKYEFSDNVSRMARGQLEHELIENMVYQFWKKNPDRAIAIWNEHSEERASDKTTVPSFILRLASKDKNGK